MTGNENYEQEKEENNSNETKLTVILAVNTI